MCHAPMPWGIGSRWLTAACSSLHKNLISSRHSPDQSQFRNQEGRHSCYPHRGVHRQSGDGSVSRTRETRTKENSRMHEQHRTGKRARSALSEEQFAQASLALIQRWRLALAMPTSSGPAPAVPHGSAVAAMTAAIRARCLNGPSDACSLLRSEILMKCPSPRVPAPRLARVAK